MYDVTFHPGNLAPLLLGLAVFAGRYDRHVSTLDRRMRMQLALPFAAIGLAAIKFPPELMLYPGEWYALSPLRFALVGAAPCTSTGGGCTATRCSSSPRRRRWAPRGWGRPCGR